MKIFFAGSALVAILCLSQSNSHAAIISFDLQGNGGEGLLGSNEPAPTGSTGTGGEIGNGIFFDDVTKQLTINVGWGSSAGFADLTGPLSGSHLHRVTSGSGFNGSGNVIQGLTRTSNTANGGTVDDFVIAIAPADESLLLSGDTYINLHTSTFGGGEIRGNLVISAVPEPGSFAALSLLAFGAVATRRRTKK